MNETEVRALQDVLAAGMPLFYLAGASRASVLAVDYVTAGEEEAKAAALVQGSPPYPVWLDDAALTDFMTYVPAVPALKLEYVVAQWLVARTGSRLRTYGRGGDPFVPIPGNATLEELYLLKEHVKQEELLIENFYVLKVYASGRVWLCETPLPQDYEEIVRKARKK